MKHGTFRGVGLLFLCPGLFFPLWLRADGGFVSRESVAVSADQRAIIIKSGKLVSTTFSTGYTGEGQDFGWIIPTPVPPAIEHVRETGQIAEQAFETLENRSAPYVVTGGGGCFLAGTTVMTTSGLQPIELVESGTDLYGYDFQREEWALTKAISRETHDYSGDVLTIQIGDTTIESTGNHPFYVVHGHQLDSRPTAGDVPEYDRMNAQGGRWVQARDLKLGDRLKTRVGDAISVIALSSSVRNVQVYNLRVQGTHNYAVNRQGILVHNKGSAERSELVVKVFGRATLEHYEVSVVGASDAKALVEWLQNNDYRVSEEADRILDRYVDEGWAFVAVKLNPSESRHYENEFLPPLTVEYEHDQLVFPLRISSISTARSVGITLYVIAENTVSSSNFVTRRLSYSRETLVKGDRESYVEACIQETIGEDDRVLVVMRKEQLYSPYELTRGLIAIPFYDEEECHLTRFETRIEPGALSEDIWLQLDKRPKRFAVSSEGTPLSWREELAIFIIVAVLMLAIFVGLPIFGLVMLVRWICRRVRSRRSAVGNAAVQSPADTPPGNEFRGLPR